MHHKLRMLFATSPAGFLIGSLFFLGTAHAAGTSLGGPWTFTLSGAHGKTHWSAYVVQIGPALAGKANSKSVKMNLSGTVLGQTVTMTWRTKGDRAKLHATLRGRSMTGSFKDTKLGSGTFTGKQGSNDDDGGGEGSDGGDRVQPVSGSHHEGAASARTHGRHHSRHRDN